MSYGLHAHVNEICDTCMPWLNDSTRALRGACRQAERRLKKDKLRVSYEILQSCLSDYQKAVKCAITEFISNLVSNNYHRPQVLFIILNTPPFWLHLSFVILFLNSLLKKCLFLHQTFNYPHWPWPPYPSHAPRCLWSFQAHINLLPIRGGPPSATNKLPLW